jgi:hypothetical protein
MAVKSLAVMYGLDVLIVLLALAGAVSAMGERRHRPLPRWRLQVPGMLGAAGTLILLSYPDIRDLADPQMWTIGLVGVAVGAVRGWAMRMETDHAFGVVRLRSGGDAAWVAWLLVLFAVVQAALETRFESENPYEKTSELLMLLTGGYLFGRSVVAWLRAGSGHHVDLQEE